jgi:DNA-binding winged helix-turn-helix (wHTH) protein/tetratricopeptide (TPR) repeat protein
MTGKQIYEFGDFQVDPAEQLLLHRGEPIPLAPKIFETLLILVQSEGRLIDKDDFMNSLWPGVFVEDVALAQNISQLRKVLGDAKGEARMIQTVPKRGYRFTPAVKIEAPAPAPAPAPLPSALTAETPSDADLQPMALIGREKPQLSARRRLLLVAAAALLLLIAVAGAYWIFFDRPRSLTAKDTLVLGDFANATGDPVFEPTLRQGLTVQLEQSPFLSLVSDERIQKTLSLMGQPSDTRLTPAISREICRRIGSAAVLDGSISNLGSQYVIALRAVDCRSGDILDAEQVQAARKEDILSALSRIATNFRTRIGESLPSVRKFDTPLPEATTASLEALQAFSAAKKLHYSSDSAASQPLYKKAIELDPNFAMAYANLGHTYGELGESDLSAEYLRKAFALRSRASEAEQFFIAASYDMRVTGNLEDARQNCDAWAQAYPRDQEPPGFLAGIVYPVFGNYEKVIEESKRAIELDPDVSFSYASLIDAYIQLLRFDQAESVIRQATERGLRTADSAPEYEIAFLRGDEAVMKREADRNEANSAPNSSFLNRQSFAVGFRGHLQQARTLSQRAVQVSQQSGQAERAALFQAAAAVREAFFGNAGVARQNATQALAASNDREVEYGAAFALALAGDTAQASDLANDLDRRFPEDTCVRFKYVPELRALVALNLGNPAQAIDRLQATSQYELGQPRTSFHAVFGELYPIYVRGLAFLAQRQGIQAAAEFQKIVDHPGIVSSDSVGAIARLQLSRAYAFSGNIPQAKTAYLGFLNLWKDADPDIPVLKQAKSEYASLQ